MKLLRVSLLALCIVLLATQATAQGRGQGQGQGRRGNGCMFSGSCPLANGASGVTFGALGDSEQKSLRDLYETEKLAHNLYTSLGATWNSAVFTRIAQSEAQHMAAIKRMLDAHGVDAADLYAAGEGEFSSPATAARYNAFLEAGAVSLAAALQAGQEMENLSLEMLKAAAASTNAPELTRVYGNLAAASDHHLAMFSGGTPAMGMGKGNGRGKGRGRGAGRGMGKGNPNGCPFAQ